LSDTAGDSVQRFCTLAEAQSRETNGFQRTRTGRRIAPREQRMKTATRLQFWPTVRTARVALVLVVMAVWVVVIVAMIPRSETAAPDTHQTSPQRVHRAPVVALV